MHIQRTSISILDLDEPEIAAPHMVNKTAFISANQTAELSCHANGNPPADNYTVLEDGRQIQTYGERNHKFLVKKGGGNYTCITRNKYLQTQTTITVNATVFKGKRLFCYRLVKPLINNILSVFLASSVSFLFHTLAAKRR